MDSDILGPFSDLMAKNLTAYTYIINRTLYLLRNQWNRTTTTTPLYEEFPYPDFSQISSVRIAFVCLFLLEFVVCVVGNTLVCLTVYRTKAMHSPVNYYIVNLGICDFLVGAFVLPTKLFELTAEANVNMLNDGWCTVVRYLETIVVFASVFTLVAICVERYYAVVYPVHSRMYLTYSRIGRVLFCVWIIPCLLAAPNIYPAVATAHHMFSDYGEFTRTTCFDRFTDEFRKGYFIFLFFFMYVIPLLFIATTCTGIFKALMRPCIAQPHRDPRAVAIEKGRRKVAKMVLVIVFAFVVCWSPYFIVTVVTQLQTENFLNEGHFFFTMLCINMLGFANSCVNPIVYFAMSARFRKGFQNIVWSMFCCSKMQGANTRSISSSSRRNSLLGTRSSINGHRHLLRRAAIGAPSSGTLNETNGTSKTQPRGLPNQREVKRNRTILLKINTSGSGNPPCASSTQFIPLCSLSKNQDDGGNGRNLGLRFQYDDFLSRQDTLIV